MQRCGQLWYDVHEDVNIGIVPAKLPEKRKGKKDEPDYLPFIEIVVIDKAFVIAARTRALEGLGNKCVFDARDGEFVDIVRNGMRLENGQTMEVHWQVVTPSVWATLLLCA